MDLSSIHITRWGETGPRVITVHGGAQGSTSGGERSFQNQKRLADDGWQLIVPDRPGHGKSPDPGRPDDAEADGAWVAELIGDGAHLVGHSFGGCVALAAAAKRPEAVRSLTLIEPAMHRLAISDPAVRKFMFRILLVSLFSFSPETKALRVMKILGIPPEIRSRSDKEELRRLGKALGRGKLPSKPELERELGIIARAGIPLLTVTGGWSEAFDVTGESVAALGGGWHVIVSSPHHFPQIVSDEFNKVLTAFMKESDAKYGASPAHP